MEWNRSEIVNMLHKGVVQVAFTKVNGEQRVMHCTLKEDLLPEKVPAHEETATRATNPDVLSVWDVEKSGWRSFRWDSLKEYKECVG